MTSFSPVLAPPSLSRRRLLAAGAGLGLQMWGSRVLAASSRRKFVLVILRGAADGLSITPPVADGDYVALRRELAITEAALPLDGDFGLHPELKTVHRLMGAGQGRFAPAVAMPAAGRSHFEAQDRLEAAAGNDVSSGWLNRAMAALGGGSTPEGLSVGPVAPLVMRGDLATSSWSPGRTVETAARLPMLVQDLYADDPLLGPALARGLKTEVLAQANLARLAADLPDASGTMNSAKLSRTLLGDNRDAGRLGGAVAGFMREDEGADVVAVSLDGFDTHANQAGALSRRLAYLDALLAGLQGGLGGGWRETVVLVVTEFGRTARVNGTSGTDHGTASTALLLGGGLKAGGLIGDWPTLQESRLFENRDLASTTDLRSLFKGVLADHLGLERRTLDTTVFPDSAQARPIFGLV
ncbi:DUF1501 domain-containing protein [Phenylobacterium sp.]|uniref:DUF1501 domain-containing protein n=1 Tax=Phenylobacterium sp. TaxID=1871053 RepID=UPI000C959337|nr:DUF1501 domain-containing protein [Phenylobacterium sp.]MAK82252.1 hypothetical protein [Phenylobacterium sp.]|tara:strand:- start:5039 stop:6274 length:1236 start_codon:yes stop_codon:yes gene_type:complete